MSDTELEDRLTAMLHERASGITTAPAFQVESAGRRGPRLAPLAVAAAVVAVVLAAGGTVVSIRSIHHRTPFGSTTTAIPTPTPTASSAPSCRPVPAPSSWRAAIDSGAVSLDHPKNSVLSTNADSGEFLALQDVPATGPTSALYRQVVVALFQGNAGANLTDPAADPNELPVADPASAIDGDWVTWGLSAPQNGSTFFKIVAYDRNRHRLIPVAQLSQAQRSANAYLGAPVLVGHQVYWLALAGGSNDPASTSLQSFDLISGTTHSKPMPGGTSLIGYRSGVAVMTGRTGQQTVVNGAGTPLSKAALAAAAGGRGFGVRGGMLSWTTGAAYHTSRIGQPTVTTASTSPAVDSAAGNTAPLLPVASTGPEQVLDLRTGALIDLPAGVVVLSSLGDRLIFGTGTDKAGSDGLSLVPVDNLPPARC
jgi:hypothetical protein